MDSNKKRLLFIVVAAVVVFALFIFIMGVEINIPGLICINKNFYPTPKTAYEKESNITEELRDISVIELDDHNAVYFAYVGDAGILVAQMKVEDNKYYYLGNEDVFYDTVAKVEDGRPATRSYPKLSSKSQYGGKIEWALIKSSDAELLSKDFKKVEIDAKLDNRALIFVYRIVED